MPGLCKPDHVSKRELSQIREEAVVAFACPGDMWPCTRCPGIHWDGQLLPADCLAAVGHLLQTH